jgi:hypothetical protein
MFFFCSFAWNFQNLFIRNYLYTHARFDLGVNLKIFIKRVIVELKQSGLSINETYGIILCNFFRKKLLKIKRNCLNFTIFSFIAYPFIHSL